MECPGLGIKLYLIERLQFYSLRNVEYQFITITPRPTIIMMREKVETLKKKERKKEREKKFNFYLGGGYP